MKQDYQSYACFVKWNILVFMISVEDVVHFTIPSSRQYTVWYMPLSCV